MKLIDHVNGMIERVRKGSQERQAKKTAIAELKTARTAAEVSAAVEKYGQATDLDDDDALEELLEISQTSWRLGHVTQVATALAKLKGVSAASVLRDFGIAPTEEPAPVAAQRAISTAPASTAHQPLQRVTSSERAEFLALVEELEATGSEQEIESFFSELKAAADQEHERAAASTARRAEALMAAGPAPAPKAPHLNDAQINSKLHEYAVGGISYGQAAEEMHRRAGTIRHEQGPHVDAKGLALADFGKYCHYMPTLSYLV